MLRSTILHAVTAMAFVAPASLVAQTGPARTPPAGCTYQTCALRIEPSFLSAPQLLKGNPGVPVGHLGFFGGDVDTLLAGPDSAAMYTRRYLTDTRRSSTLGLLGTAAFIVALATSDNGHDPDAVTTTAAVASVGFAIATIPFALRAARSMSRAVWFYNAALPSR